MYRIAAIPGDGIGNEVLPAAARCLDTIGSEYGFHFDWNFLDWSSERLKTHGAMMPVDGLDQLRDHEAIFLGAVGVPEVPDAETLWGLLIPIRRTFDQYINLRPAKSLPGVAPRVTNGNDIDMLIVRENCEGEYSEIGGRAFKGFAEEIAIQETVFTRRGVTRVADYAIDLASRRKGRLTSATKSNGIVHTMPFWDEIVTERVNSSGAVTLDAILIDALAAALVLRPSTFDVIVASNLFGDILSDLAGALTGSIGVLPSANLNPEGTYPSMFEPVHGSAPDIAGRGIANPIGQVWAGCMMLEHLGHVDAASRLFDAIAATTAAGITTRDLGGSATTDEVAEAIIRNLKESA